MLLGGKSLSELTFFFQIDATNSLEFFCRYFSLSMVSNFLFMTRVG